MVESIFGIPRHTKICFRAKSSPNAPYLRKKWARKYFWSIFRWSTAKRQSTSSWENEAEKDESSKRMMQVKKRRTVSIRLRFYRSPCVSIFPRKIATHFIFPPAKFLPEVFPSERCLSTKICRYTKFFLASHNLTFLHLIDILSQSRTNDRRISAVLSD